MTALNTLSIDPKLRPALLERIIGQDHPAHEWPVEPAVTADPKLSDVARSITDALVGDPGHLVVEVGAAGLSDAELISAAWNLFTVVCSPVAQYANGELITSVRVATARPGVSHYATTSMTTGGYHTDGTELATPPDVTGLLCVSSADVGGETLLMDGHRVLDELPAEHRAALSVPLWFHSGVDGSPERHVPVVAGTRLRYLRRYIEEGHRRRGEEPPTAAMDALDRITDRSDLQLPVLLHRGELLMWDNNRFVHGRRPFTEQTSRRWLVRIYGMLRGHTG